MEISPQAQCEAAFTAHGGEILRFVSFKLADRQDAEDVASDTFVRYWEKLKGGERIENPRALLFTIARGLLIDLYRKKGRRTIVSVEDLDELFEPETHSDEADSRLTHARVLEKVHLLKDRYAEVILMHYVEGLSITAMAETLGETENTVRVRLHRSLEKLREQFAYEGT